MLAGTFVVFGDWAISQGQAESSSISTEKQDAFPRPFRQSSVGVRVGYAKLQRGYRSKLMQALLSMELEGCFSESGTTLEHEKLNYPSFLASFMVCRYTVHLLK
jgi:hypothetical protein